MLSVALVVFSVISVTSCEDLAFPPGFQLGVASSAYQIEGAWNANDKGESIWDRFTHRPTAGQNGDVACDSHRLWRRDLDMVEELGVNFYRFSISWTRILPKGFTNYVSKDGVKYYSDLIDGLLEKGIEPVVTLYHGDLPQRLQNLGGWTNPLVSDWFADYSRVVFSLYADRVKTWITISEPALMCQMAYTGALAPGLRSTDVGALLCSKHVLLAHARAWRVYDEEFRGKYHGRVSLTNLAIWFEPVSEEDGALAELAQQYLTGLYCHPIFSAEGGWPAAVEEVVSVYSEAQGYPHSNLPRLTTKEAQLIKGTYDFFALSYFTSRTIRRSNGSSELRPWPAGDAPLLGAKLDDGMNNLEGLRKLLSWLKSQYGDLSYVVAASGLGTLSGLDDEARIHYIRDHLRQVLIAIQQDSINVTAFTAWSLMDGFEWTDGYKTKYGLYEVDFSSESRTRVPRASAVYYSSVSRTRSLDVVDDVRLTIEASTSDSVSTVGYIFIAGGLLLAVLIAGLVLLARKRRMTHADKTKYIGVVTDDKMAA